MNYILSYAVIFTFVVVVARDPMKKFIREGKEPIGKRDYTPSKWVTNSAMDVWYGNKSMIDILWREFSDVMYKLTDRKFRSTRLEDFKLNTTDGNASIQETKVNIINSHNVSVQNSNINNASIYSTDTNNVSLYNHDINNVTLYNNDINNVTLYNNDINNVTLYNNDINNVSLYNNDASKESLYDSYINNVSSYNNDIRNGSIPQLLLDLILLYPLNSTKHRNSTKHPSFN